ncbi:MAG: hypothetical protein H6717_26085 [Polyangiaceae bacterium]|nr:hypothetical protein [Polyangiaceae bacterium]
MQAQHYPPQPYAPAKAKPPVLSILAAVVALGLGMITFLIAGFRGHSAGWEMMAAPTALTGLAGLVGFVGGLGALSRKSFLVALGLIAVSGLGGLLAVAGFVLGA